MVELLHLCFGTCVNKLTWIRQFVQRGWAFCWLSFYYLPITAGYELAPFLFGAIVNQKQWDTRELFMLLVIRHWTCKTRTLYSPPKCCKLFCWAINSLTRLLWFLCVLCNCLQLSHWWHLTDYKSATAKHVTIINQPNANITFSSIACDKLVFI